MIKLHILYLTSAVVLLAAGSVRGAENGENAEELGALRKMPIKEVTVFKDGHAFVLHEGTMPVDKGGAVVLDYLPTPVLGTYWPYSNDSNAKLTSVVASRRRVKIDQIALDLPSLLKANVGAKVIITEGGKKYSAKIIAVPTRSSKELRATGAPNSAPRLPQEGSVILLEIEDGVKVVKLARISDVTFVSEYKTRRAKQEFRNVLSLGLTWKDGKSAKTADVGMMYLQKGLRWIPGYKVAIDGKGKAAVKLQVTLVNDLTDLKDATVHLVIGVPTFAFAGMTDPISLQEAAAEVARRYPGGARSREAMLMSQRVSMDVGRAAAEAPRPGGGPEVTAAEGKEDLFVFTVQHVTLKKGRRMVLPVKDFSLNYKDVYVLDIPFSPPQEVWRNFNRRQLTEMTRLSGEPKVMHKIRLENKSDCPLTTAPALILLEDRLLAQGLMSYTSIGSKGDLNITHAVDIKIKKSDKETKRIPKAVQWDNHWYGRVNLTGNIKITNYRKEAADLEVTRYALGRIDECNHDGKIEMVNALEDPSFLP
ncbi:MAG: hypothetical protein QF792_00865, partial [Phycisphaerae bacterium]|nr:hypothetical protein [Phycisphaerae bacterium]